MTGRSRGQRSADPRGWSKSLTSSHELIHLVQRVNLPAFRDCSVVFCFFKSSLSLSLPELAFPFLGVGGGGLLCSGEVPWVCVWIGFGLHGSIVQLWACPCCWELLRSPTPSVELGTHGSCTSKRTSVLKLTINRGLEHNAERLLLRCFQSESLSSCPGLSARLKRDISVRFFRFVQLK